MLESSLSITSASSLHTLEWIPTVPPPSHGHDSPGGVADPFQPEKVGGITSAECEMHFDGMSLTCIITNFI